MILAEGLAALFWCFLEMKLDSVKGYRKLCPLSFFRYDNSSVLINMSLCLKYCAVVSTSSDFLFSLCERVTDWHCGDHEALC
jgi:hypothetical protein